MIFSIVIVTYYNDFDKLRHCLKSIDTHLKNTDVPIIIVLNDTVEHFDELKKLADSQCARALVIHHSTVADWPYQLDWWSQQYYKLAVATQISTPWYLVIDSDDVIIKDLTIDQLFDQRGRARCLTEPRECIDSNQIFPLKKWLEQAYDTFKVEQLPFETMGNLTPFIMNTQVTQQMFYHISIDCFNVRTPEQLTLEFYLYYAYLDQQKLFQNLYSPVKKLHYAVDKRHIDQ